MSNFGYCPKCHRLVCLTDHHVFPKRFFGENNSKLKLCRECHDEIELLIPLHVKLPKEMYIQIVKSFLLGLPNNLADEYIERRHKKR